MIYGEEDTYNDIANIYNNIIQKDDSNQGNKYYLLQDFDCTEKINKQPKMENIIQSTNLYVYSMNNPIKYIDSTGEAVKGIAAAGYVAFGVRINAQVCFVKDDEGNSGIIAITSIGGGTPNAGISGAVFYNYSADNIYDLENMSVSVGGSAGDFGIDINGDLSGGSISYGKSALPGDLHGEVTFGKILFTF